MIFSLQSFDRIPWGMAVFMVRRHVRIAGRLLMTKMIMKMSSLVLDFFELVVVDKGVAEECVNIFKQVKACCSF